MLNFHKVDEIIHLSSGKGHIWLALAVYPQVWSLAV